MASRREVIEQHLKSAHDSLSGRSKLLGEHEPNVKKHKKDVTFRAIQATIRQYTRRLKALDKVDAVNADVEQRRAERLAKPKEPKIKKKKVVEAPKAKSAKKEKKAAT